jgi:hypothetical protein
METEYYIVYVYQEIIMKSTNYCLKKVELPWDQSFHIQHTSEIIWYFYFCAWLILLNMMISSSICCYTWKVFILFYGWIIFHCVYVPCFLYPFICLVLGTNRICIYTSLPFTHGAYLWLIGLWVCQNYTTLFHIPRLLSFQKVLNALGKVAKKDIWIQEPESKVSLATPSP